MGHGSSTERSAAHHAVTARIVEAIEAGAEAFVMPWHREGVAAEVPTNAVTGNRYQGGNVVSLWAEATLSGYGSGFWASYRQWQSVGAQVRRGEHGAIIVFYKQKPVDEHEDEGRGERRLIYLARSSAVFNADQVEGWEPPAVRRPAVAEVIHTAERFVRGSGAIVRHGFNQACYRHLEDVIEFPDRDRFTASPTRTATEAYYAVLLHELVHWSGAGHRLDRTFDTPYGGAAYAAEELVAELGAAFLCADLKLANEPRPDHAAYVAHWLGILKSDARAIFTAAHLASEATRYLAELADEPEPSL